MALRWPHVVRIEDTFAPLVEGGKTVAGHPFFDLRCFAYLKDQEATIDELTGGGVRIILGKPQENIWRLATNKKNFEKMSRHFLSERIKAHAVKSSVPEELPLLDVLVLRISPGKWKPFFAFDPFDGVGQFVYSDRHEEFDVLQVVYTLDRTIIEVQERSLTL